MNFKKVLSLILAAAFVLSLIPATVFAGDDAATGGGTRESAFQYSSVYAAGNGTGPFMNGVSWDPAAPENEMEEVSDGIYEITFEDVPAGNDYCVKFALDGSWSCNFGASAEGGFNGFGLETDAVFNGENIVFDLAFDADVKLRLDLSGFDYDNDFSGAKYQISVKPEIVSVDIDALYVTEKVDGHYDYDGDFFFYDTAPSRMTVTVAGCDEPFTGDFGYIESLFGYDIGCESGQDLGFPFELGENEAWIRFCDNTYDYAVFVSEKPEIESVEIDPVELIELRDGEIREGFGFYYDAAPRHIKVTLGDGTVVEGAFSYIRYRFNSDFTCSQDKGTPLTLGANEGKLRIYDSYFDYTINLMEKPDEIVSFNLDSPTIMQYKDGTFQYPGWCWYNPCNFDYTVVMSNGDEYSGDYYDVSYYIESTYGISVSWPDEDQNKDNEWGVGDHTFTITADGTVYEFTVTVIPFTVDGVEVASIGVSDVTLCEFSNGTYTMNGYFDDESYVEPDEPWFEYFIEPDFITVYDSNGDEIKTIGREEEFDYFGNGSKLSLSQRFDRQLTPGTYDVEYSICGFVTDYELTINPCPVRVISAEGATVTVNSHGHTEQYSEYDDEGQYLGERERFIYDAEPGYVTVEDVATGETERMTFGELWSRYSLQSYAVNDQSQDNVWGVGSYVAAIYITGARFEYPYDIRDGIVASVWAEDIAFTEGTNMYTHTWYNNSGEHGKGIAYNSDPRSVRVDFTDGTFFEGPLWEFRDLYRDVVDCWTEVPEMTVGSNTVTLHVDDKECTYTITIEKTPVVSVSATGSSVMEGTHCSQRTDDREYGETPSYTYYDCDPGELTVKFEDGTEFTGSSFEFEQEYGYGTVYVLEDQEYENQWGVGEHPAKVMVMGVEADFVFEITENDITSIVPSAIALFEYTDGYYIEGPDGPFRYYYDVSTFIVTHEGGKQDFLDRWALYDTYGMVVTVSDDQETSPWGVGPHDSTFTLRNAGDYSEITSGTFSVYVYESEVDRIEVEPITMLEGVQTFEAWYDDGVNEPSNYTAYYYYIPVTMIMKDGSRISFEGMIEYGGHDYYEFYFDDQGPDNSWGLGEHEVTVIVGGKRATTTVTIVHNPVSDVVFDRLTVRRGIDGAYRDIYGPNGPETFFWYNYFPEFTVILEDGTEIRSDRGGVDLLGARYEIWYFDEQDDEHWDVGVHYVTMIVLGVEKEVEVEVVANDIDTLEIKDEFGEIKITLSSGTSSEVYVLQGIEFRSSVENGRFEAVFNTDHGNLTGEVNFELSENGVNRFGDNVTFRIGALTSNTLDEALSLKIMIIDMYLPTMAGLLRAKDPSFGGVSRDKYDGDDVVALAVNLFADFSFADAYTPGSTFVVVKSDTAREAVMYLFGIDDVEIPRCSGYNAKCGNIRVEILDGDFRYGESSDVGFEGEDFMLYIDCEPFEETDYGYMRIAVGPDATVWRIEFRAKDEVESVEIREENDGEPAVIGKVTFTSGEVVEFKVLAFAPTNFGPGYTDGILYTDKGDVEARIYTKESENGVVLSGTDLAIEVDGVKSNTLKDSLQFRGFTMTGIVLYAAAAEKTVTEFSGYDGAEYDVAYLAAIAVKAVVNYYFNGDVEPGADLDKVTLSAATVREALGFVFGIDNADLSPITNADGSVTVYLPHAEDYAAPDATVTATGDGFTAYAASDMFGVDVDFESVTLTYDKNFVVKSIAFEEKEPEFVPGDVDGDGDVTMKDVLIMRRYIAGLDELDDDTIARGDFDGDGEITTKDVLRARRIIAGLD